MSVRQLTVTASSAEGAQPTASRPVIVQVAGYYPPHLGGAERVVQSLSEQLASRGYDVQVLTSAVDAPVGTEQPLPGLSVRRFKAWEFAHTPWAPAVIPALWRVPKRSILHLHLAQALYPELVWLTAKLRRLPYVVHFHLDLQPSGPLGKLFLIYKATVIRLVIKQADRVIVFSTAQQQFIHERYGVPKDRIAIIPNGVGTEYFHRPRHYRTSARQLLNIGRLSPQKRLNLLVAAMADLPDCQLTLVGDGEERSRLEAQVKRLGLTNVTFTGSKSPAETLAYYQAADIFVIPSEREGMPLVVLEAMAGGLPIVAAQVPGLQELVDGVGVLVDQPQASVLAEVIQRLLSDKSQLDRLSRQSVQTARGYSWERLTDAFEALYKELDI